MADSLCSNILWLEGIGPHAYARPPLTHIQTVLITPLHSPAPMACAYMRMGDSSLKAG